MMHDLSETEFMTYEALYKNQGARIMFKCDQVTYQGIIDLILPDIRQVRLRHTKVIEGNKYFGKLRFQFRDISNFTVVESAENVNRFPKNEYLLSILRNNQRVPNVDVSKALYGDKLSDQSDDEDIVEEKKEEQFVLDVPEHLESKLPNDYAVIDIFNADFDKAVQYIARQQIIGVSFEGSEISRFGKLTLICISTNICLFVFDIQQLGKESFDKGLRQIFESKSTKKVIHDCRFPSDCLAHQYATLLTNVFDTRVADFLVNKQQYNDKYQFNSFSSLDCCLRNYLRVPQEFLYKRESSSNQEAVSSKRPISNESLYDILKNVLYLNLLYEVLSKELLSPVYKASDYYCTILSKSSKQLIDTLGSELSSPDSIPQCLLMNGIQTVCFRKPQKSRNVSLSCTFVNNETGKVVDSKTALHTPPIVVKDSLNLKDKRQSETSSIFLKKTNNFCETNQKKNSLLTNVVFSVPKDNLTENINSLSVKPSFRHLDEVYHKLINRMHSDQFDSVIDVKPSNNYVSTFSVKQSPSLCTSAVSDFSDNESSKYSDLEEPFERRCLPSNKDIGECQVPWSKLLAEEILHSSNQNKGFKTRFMPG